MKHLCKVRNRYKSYRKSIFWYKRDVLNRLIHGDESPISCERIHIDPGQVRWVIDPDIFGRNDSGRIVGGDWDLNTSNIQDFPKYLICRERFVNGKSWEEAGAYELMMSLIKKEPGADGCHTFNDIITRYEVLDKIYRQVKRQNKLLNRQELKPRNFRESGGVYVHFDRNANIIFGDGGCHRLSISKILKLKIIPAQIGVMHEEALSDWRNSLE